MNSTKRVRVLYDSAHCVFDVWKNVKSFLNEENNRRRSVTALLHSNKS